jgi:hypothetical protein
MRAQEEQERLEEELERERLVGELGIQEHPAGFQEKQNSQPSTFDNQLAKVSHTDLGSARTIYPEPTQHSPPVRHHEEQTERDVRDVGGLSTRDDEGNLSSPTPSGGAGQTRVAGLLLPPGQVEISFWAFERDRRKVGALTKDIEVECARPSAVALRSFAFPPPCYPQRSSGYRSSPVLDQFITTLFRSHGLPFV